MSIYYLYPNSIFLKKINDTFHCQYTECDNISDIWDDLIRKGYKENKIKSFFVESINADFDVENKNKKEIIELLEEQCRKGYKKILGPGAMSNFPDRYDGFHTYNRCCRSKEDKGRSKENLKSYTKDRRAYEYWSDGNIHAANQFMGSSFFNDISADHIGPISLGFVHDPRYLQRMTNGDNSAKRDRLSFKDVEKIIETEAKTGICPISWQSKLIWEYIKENYVRNKHKISTIYRDALKQNMANYMFILKNILERCHNNGRIFLVESFLKDKFDCFNYSYKFNSNGEIISKEKRHFTKRNEKEIERYVRIAIDSIYDYNDKENRNKKEDLTRKEKEVLFCICLDVENNSDFVKSKKKITSLVEEIECRLIGNF